MELSDARYLARVIADISNAPLATNIIEAAKLCFLDYLASSFAGARSEVAISGLATLMAYGEGNSTILSHEKTSSLLGSAYFHGLIATVEDLDDAHRFASGLHMSATTFPVAMALGEKLSSSGEAFFKAVVSGYEISSRLCRAADAGLRERGFHSTGAVGPFGACAVACSLLKLDEDRTTHALGIAASGTGGLFAFLQEGSSVRHVHAAWASTNGLQAALMAEQSILGPEKVFEGEDGYFNAYTTGYNADFIRKSLPSQSQEFEISNAYHKIYHACGHAIPVITGLLDVRKDLLERVDDIQEINIRAYKGSAALTNATPSTFEEAKFSLPVITALTILHGNISDRELRVDIRNQEDVKKLAQKVNLSEDAKIHQAFPKLRSTEFDIIFSNGEKITKYVDAPIGMPENPVSWNQIEQKFRNASKSYLTGKRQDQIITHLIELTKKPSISNTVKSLRK